MQRLRQELRRLADQPLPLPPSLKDRSFDEEEDSFEEARRTRRYASRDGPSFAKTRIYREDDHDKEQERRTREGERSMRPLLKLGEEELGLLRKYNIHIPSLARDELEEAAARHTDRKVREMGSETRPSIAHVGALGEQGPALSMRELSREHENHIPMSWEAKRAFAEAASRSYSYSVRRESSRFSRSSNVLDSHMFDDWMDEQVNRPDDSHGDVEETRMSGQREEATACLPDVNVLIQQLQEQAMHERLRAQISNESANEILSHAVSGRRDQDLAVKTQNQEVQTDESNSDKQQRSDIAGVLKETLHELSLVVKQVRSRLQKEQHKEQVSELNGSIKHLSQQVEEMQVAKRDAQTYIDVLESDCANLRRELETMQSSHSNLSTVEKQQKDLILELTDQLHACREQLRAEKSKLLTGACQFAMQLRQMLAGSAPAVASLLSSPVRSDKLAASGYKDGLLDLEHMLKEIKALKSVLADYLAEKVGQDCAMQ
ncbi:hypothetical protein GUITHDRAFT_141918 [Guillardia theta CCMP2712]|uniref:Uncharacterized protein n=1 Tax=Guillardia theta (strain CCMP2712) TaxID=905079 RepID=L1IZK8_GUITC|nr:hypothetical protein GUITHDRAFT_141918 [Guillardia theta CCMP2712]EKX41681.1 hypothetical protein GUITHDRAFT_141918 [Guillardia theta CCMP2712]|eukprot:XP_005828661.1 hypothetical protein GUITHDRAFT_141918 [Guillardia theta CCMP2712]